MAVVASQLEIEEARDKMARARAVGIRKKQAGEDASEEKAAFARFKAQHQRAEEKYAECRSGLAAANERMSRGGGRCSCVML